MLTHNESEGDTVGEGKVHLIVLQWNSFFLDLLPWSCLLHAIHLSNDAGVSRRNNNRLEVRGKVHQGPVKTLIPALTGTHGQFMLNNS